MAKGKIGSLSLPQAGGAQRGLGEKFSPELFTGTGNFSIPIAVPEGRNGFQPSLSLNYSTGGGNGLFGQGFSLAIPSVSRASAHGLPRYEDDADTFVLSGLEDLVAIPSANAAQQAYRPRTEVGFARIVHHKGGGLDYWSVHSKDGLVSEYGSNPSPLPADFRDPAVVRDPGVTDDTPKLFSWLLTATRDPFGNRIEYLYELDEGRDGPRHWSVPLLREIRYIDYGSPRKFLVSVVFVYENRPDAYSSYRAGFEIRTTKRCQRIDIKVNQTISELLKTYTLNYRQSYNGVSLLQKIQVTGYDESGKGQSLPAICLDYSEFDPEAQQFAAIDIPGLPQGSLLSPAFALVDITGNGLPDVLELSSGVPRFWENQGDGRFAPATALRDAPAGLHLGDPGVTLMDTDGNGRQDLVLMAGPNAGVFPMRFDGGWDRRSFRPYRHAPSFNLLDAEVHLVDLDGDGAVDALRAGSHSLECFFQDRQQGWHEVRVFPRRGLDAFPNIPFSDPRVRFADMSGDGLQDIVLVHRGSVDYWPARGRAEWGGRIAMENPPRFPEPFDPRRLLIGDIDGDGCADIVYVTDRKVFLWLNQQGERFAEPIIFTNTPSMSTEDSVRLVDLYGVGVSGLLWIANPYSPHKHKHYFLDFTGRVKPNLLVQLDNSMGAVTRVRYSSSITYAIQDAERGQQWQTPLPFPVQVVADSEVRDTVSQTRVLTQYTYHHGYWDGEEREFRGFGRVDRRDSEMTIDYQRSDTAGKVAPEHFSPPTETRTWFHQGAVGDDEFGYIELEHTNEYWPEDENVLRRSQEAQDFLARLPPRALRDALRSMRGRTLRTELYALDESAQAGRPYTVSEQLHAVSGLPGVGRSADEVLPADPFVLSDDDPRLHVFFPYQAGERSSQWERSEPQKSQDGPLVSYSLTGRFDHFGQALEQLSIAVPRSRALSAQRPTGAGEPFLVTLTRTSYAEPKGTAYIADRVASVRSFGVVSSGTEGLPDLVAAAWALSKRVDAAGAALPTGLSVLSSQRHYYDGKDFDGRAFGEVGDSGALMRSEQLAMDQKQLERAFGVDVPPMSPPLIPPFLPPYNTPTKPPSGWPSEHWTWVFSQHPNAGYVLSGDDYYSMTLRARYDAQGLLLESRDALGRATSATYAAPYNVRPAAVTDAAGLTTQATYNWHFLQPQEITDPNGNRTRVEYTPLGLVERHFIRGKTASEGDVRLPSEYYEYHFERVPVFVHVHKREFHDGDADRRIASRKDRTIQARTYSDGFGRVVQTRTQAEQTLYGESILGGGRDLLHPDVRVTTAGSLLTPSDEPKRVVVSEWKRYDNKGRVVEQAEPYFDTDFDKTALPTKNGAVTRTHYDPLGRVVRTDSPDGSQTRILRAVPPRDTSGNPVLSDPDAFHSSPWEVWTYDANDNVNRDRVPGSESIADGRVGRSDITAHADTPSSAVLDALGRTIKLTQRLSTDPKDAYEYVSTYDLVGNLLSQRDPRGRIVTSAIYDYQKKPLYTRSLDAGGRWVVHDASGMVVYGRDERGASQLSIPGAAGRPYKTWACDDRSQDITLRLRLHYGDEDTANLDKRKAQNQLGRLYVQFDEAGRLRFDEYDFKGNVRKRTRNVIADAAIQAVAFPKIPPGPSGAEWQISPYRVAWTDVTSDEKLLDSSDYTTESDVDALGRLKWLSYPLPKGTKPTLLPDYNQAGMLRRLELDEGGGTAKVLVEHVAYNAKGQKVLQVTACSKSAGTIDARVLSRYAYDEKTFRLVRMRSETCKLETGDSIKPSGNPLQDHGYVYDRVGNVWQLLDRTPQSGVKVTGGDENSLTRRFTYDALYRLRSASGRETKTALVPTVPADLLWDSGPWNSNLDQAQFYNETYTYDEVGFLIDLVRTSQPKLGGTQKVKRTYKGVEAAGERVNNRLLSTTVSGDPSAPGYPFEIPYDYDEAGHMTTEFRNRHYEWDAAGRLRVFRNQTDAKSEPSVHVHYLYDASGQRVKKLRRNSGGDWSSIVYIDGVYEHRRDASGMVSTEERTLHVLDGQKRLGLRRLDTPLDKQPQELLSLPDHLGSCNVELNWSDGRFVAREEFRPFGETSFGSYAKKRYRFTGKERDEESGLSYHGARYYAPWLSRWLSPDPAGTVDGVNLYAYARSNPIGHIDPDGNQAQDNNITISRTDVSTDVSAPNQSKLTGSGSYLTSGVKFQVVLESINAESHSPGESASLNSGISVAHRSLYSKSTDSQNGEVLEPDSRYDWKQMPPTAAGRIPIPERTLADPKDLIRVNQYGDLDPKGAHYLMPHVAQALRDLRQGAAAAGFDTKKLFTLISAYRSQETQNVLHENSLQHYSDEKEASAWVAKKHSEHKTGRAFDIYLGLPNKSKYQISLEYQKLPAYQWMVANARKYGFNEFIWDVPDPHKGEFWHYSFNVR